MENIRPVRLSDAGRIREIYAPYVSTSITFEIEVPTEAEIAHRIEEYTKSYPWIVLEQEGAIIAYAYATTFKARAAYRWSVETSIYVDEKHKGKGLGKKLYQELLSRLSEKGVLNMVGVITLPNQASVTLHESLGFEFVGKFPDVGFKLGKWWDVGYWQLALPKPETPEELK